MTHEDQRHSWVARYFISLLPSPWCWPRAYGIEDLNDAEKWAEVGRKMAEGKSHLTRHFAQEYEKAVAYVEAL